MGMDSYHTLYAMNKRVNLTERHCWCLRDAKLLSEVLITTELWPKRPQSAHLRVHAVLTGPALVLSFSCPV